MVQEAIDEALVAEVKDGNIQAFEILVRRYQHKLLRLATRITGQRELAEEVAQDAFFSVYQTIDRVDMTKKFSSYLFAIVRNRAVSALRRLKPQISLETFEELGQDSTIMEKLLEDADRDAVNRAIEYLPFNYRKAIRLYYFDALSYEEIAMKLKIPVNTVRTHLRRAKQILKKAISI